MRHEHPPVPVIRPVSRDGRAAPEPLAAPAAAGARAPARSAGAARGADQRGDTYAFVLLLPATHRSGAVARRSTPSSVVNARSEASVAASQGLRAIWATYGEHAARRQRSTHARSTRPERRADVGGGRGCRDPSGRQREAAGAGGLPAPTAVYSDRCGGTRPDPGTAGWARVVVSGEAIGPLNWLWPGRSDTVYASAEGPAVLSTHGERLGSPSEPVPEQWSQSDLAQC